MKQRKEWIYGMLILIENCLLGIGNPVAKYGMSSFPFFLYMAIRFLMGSLFLIIVFRKKIRAGLNLAFWKHGTIIAVLTVAAYIPGTLTFKYTTATSAGFLFALVVVFTPFLMRIISRVKIERKRYIPIVIVVAGAYFLCCGTDGFQFGKGEALALLSTFLMACVFEFSSVYLAQMEPLLLAAYQAGFTGVVCLILSITNREVMPPLQSIPGAAWGALLYLGIVCAGITYCLQNFALSKINSTKAALIMCSQPVFTAAASFIMLGERMTGLQAAGGLIIMGGIIYASLMSDNKKNRY